MPSHFAALTTAKGKRFTIVSRSTPKPGPGELLVQVKCIGLNPADGLMRDQGLLITAYPTIVGFDIAGLVLEVGEGVPTGGTESGDFIGNVFRPGVTRVAAYSAAFWKDFDPDYGAFQEVCLIPWQHATELPDSEISWMEAATLPVATQVALSAWDAMGISVLGESQNRTPNATGSPNTEALLIWGASSSVGTMGVQSARLMRDDASSSIGAVYATASATNHSYLATLGADRLFDYKDPDVLDAIISTARCDGLSIRHCFLAAGPDLELCQSVLSAFINADSEPRQRHAKIASAPPLSPEIAVMDSIDAIFLMPPASEEARLDHFQASLGTWLRLNLASKTIKPSPEARLVGKGLLAINSALDQLVQGVSCKKLVIEVAE